MKKQIAMAAALGAMTWISNVPAYADDSDHPVGQVSKITAHILMAPFVVLSKAAAKPVELTEQWLDESKDPAEAALSVPLSAVMAAPAAVVGAAEGLGDVGKKISDDCAK